MYGADVVASGAMQLFEDYTEPLVCHLAYCLPRARVDTMKMWHYGPGVSYRIERTVVATAAIISSMP